MTDTLERVYRNRAVSSVIVESKRGMANRLYAALSEYVTDSKFRVFEVFDNRFKPSFKYIGFNMIAISLAKQLVEEVAQRRDVETIYPDMAVWALSLPEEYQLRDRQGNIYTSTYYVKKQLGLFDSGCDGLGVKIGVIDTGCRNMHPQMGAVNTDTVMLEKGGTGIDMNGHGTHVGSTIAGRSVKDSYSGHLVEGMAPNADLYSVQALGLVIGMGTQSDTIDAMNKCIEKKVKIINMSIGGELIVPEADNPEAIAIEEVVKNGIIPVCASGNSGPKPGTVTSPGSIEKVLTVGSIDYDGEVSSFSSRGPTADDVIKPDVVSYGNSILSGLVGYLDYQIDKPQMHFGILSGTSMATPQVSGLLAHMAELYSKRGLYLDLNEVKTMLLEVGQPKNNDTGWGLLDWDMVKTWMSSQHG